MKSPYAAALVLALAGAAGTAQAGQLPAVQVHGEQAESLAISCARPALPTQKKVAKVLQVSNFDETYDLRAQVMVVAARACKAGYAQVLVQRSGPGRLNWVAMR
jgi:hypothetical protein